MKRKLKSGLFYLITGLFLGFTLESCSDDDDKGAAFNPEGKRLVEKIIYTEDNDSENKGEITFSYDGEGRLTAFNRIETYKENNKKYTYSEQVAFTVSGNKLTVVQKILDSEYPEDAGAYTGVFTLNEDGYVVSGQEKDIDEDAFVYECQYDDSRHLVKMEYTRNGREETPIKYTWENGNIVKGVYQRTYTYFDKENKSNLDFTEVTGMEFMLGYDRSYLGLAGYLGKTNKDLLKSSDSYSYSYDYDEDGYVVTFRMTSNDKYGGTNVYKVSYK